MFCREQVAGFRSRKDELDRMGVGLFFIGNGSPAMAAEFREQFGVDVPVWVDRGRQSYDLLGFQRSLESTLLDLSVFAHGLRALRGGFMQGRTKGHPYQQGGVVVIRADGTPAYVYASKTAGDHPALDEVVAAARAAVG